MFKPRKEFEDLLLSKTEKCETVIDETYREAEETLAFKPTKSRGSFSINPPLLIEESWMIGLINLEVYNSVFNITEKNTKFEICFEFTQSFEETTFETSKDLI